MNILAIETSCDDTCISILTNEIDIYSVSKSQFKVLNKNKGIIPEITSRKHSEIIFDLINHVLLKVNLKLKDLDGISVTGGPGLISSLNIGLTVAKTLSMLLSIPFYSMNHLESHIYSPFINKKVDSIPKKAICLVLSGGHTQIYILNNFNVKLIGQTRDDAIGESFDKVAKILFKKYYDGGQYIDNFYKKNHGKIVSNIYFPKVNLEDYDFSFSGLKTYINTKKGLLPRNQLSIEFQKEAVEQIIRKVIKAVNEFKIYNIIIGGGVSSNSLLRSRLMSIDNVKLYLPDIKYTSDNAAMIGYLFYIKNSLKVIKKSKLTEEAKSRWQIK